MKTINDLQQLVGSLALNNVQAKKLNVAAGNAMRRVVRGNLKDQKDIRGKSFKARKKSSYVQAASGKISLNTKMFAAASRSLSQDANTNGVSVGYSKVIAKIFAIHNSGGKIAFKKRSGKFIAYAMPKREFLGWSPDMVKQVEDAITTAYLKFSGV